MNKYNLITILGPTASGKTALAARLAADLGSQIISADSRQVYRGMDIGTGKDLDEFEVDGRNIPCHIIDIIDPSEEFSLYDFQKIFFEVFDKLNSTGGIPILVGGTGLYIDSVLRGYSMHEVPINDVLRKEMDGQSVEAITERLKIIRPDLHNTTDLMEKERAIRALEIAIYERDHEVPKKVQPEIYSIVFGTRWERKELKERITRRLKERLNSGMIEEVEKLHSQGISWEKLDYFGLEYRYVAQFLQGKINRNDMFQRLNSAIHNFAKKQETWFRRMERHGVKIHWIDKADYGTMKAIIDDKLSGLN